MSPLSAEIVLSLTQSGCKDATAEEIRRTLHLPNNTRQLQNSFKTLLPTLTRSKLYTLKIANKMYIKNKYRIKSKFKKLAKEIYKAETESIAFSNKRKAAKKINRWVEKRTKNKIRNLISPKSLNKKTRVVLVNALYFKAQWSVQFDHLLATKNNFYKIDNERIEVEMMHHNQDHLFNYYESSELSAKFVELPFKGDEASMVIVLPNDTQALARLDDQIDKVLKVDNFTSEPLNVLLPKFRIDARINMKSILKRVGEGFGRVRE